MSDSDPRLDKQRLRRHFRELRRRQNQATAGEAAGRLLNSLPHWDRVQSVALYMASDGELDPSAIAGLCRTSGRHIVLPRIQGPTIEFATWAEGDALQNNRYGIPEPPPRRESVPLDEIDLLCMPLVAYDRSGTRLGMGGGYYDRCLASRSESLTLLGLAHSCQEAKALPQQAWDQRLHWVLTEKELIDCRGRTITPSG